MSCSAKKSLTAGHIVRFQIHLRWYVISTLPVSLELVLLHLIVPEGWYFCRKAGIYPKMPSSYPCKEGEVALYMQIEKNIAATLQNKMRESGKTKLEFSKELGIPRSTLQGYLKGEKCLRSDSIEELAKSLHISSAQLIAGPEHAGAFKPFSMCALLAEHQVLHPQAQALAREAASLLDAAFRISEEWKRLDAQSTAFVQENPIDAQPAPFVHEDPNAAYRYILYEEYGFGRIPYAYGLLRQKRQADGWITIAIAAPFSNNRSGVVQLAECCTEHQLDPIHFLDVLHDFMDAEARTL